MTIEQATLPYDTSALEPHVSKETLSFHYGRHHKGYIAKLNKLVKGTEFEKMSLEQVIDKARTRAEIGILNNALQAWNHAFLWESMSPDGGGKPDGRIAKMIESQYGSFESFKEKFREAAVGLFGSGWVWLVVDRGELRIVATGNADSPVGTQLTPLLVLDVWEHAYYLDYQNERDRYIDTFLDHLINWNFAAANLEKTDNAKAA